jgi:hypothetical protein
MSVEVDIEYWPSITMDPRTDARYDHSFGRPPDNNHWIRMSSQPDFGYAGTFVSVQIVEEWFWIDGVNVVHCGVHWRNNSDKTIVFRPKGVVVPSR